MTRIPRWVFVAVASVAVVGTGVATAAVTSGSGAEVGEEPTTTSPTEPVTTTLPDGDDPTDEEPADESADDSADGTPRYWGPECGEDPTNHGGYVSRAEKNGESRREAAHSPCGKPLSSVKTTPTSTPIEEPPLGDETLDATESPAPGGSNGNGNGNGNGGGKGNGKGGGKGKGGK